MDETRAIRDEREAEDAPEPPRLRFLRRLVTLLTASMIVGILIIAATLALRLQPSGGAGNHSVAPFSVQAELAPGEEIRSIAVDGGRLLVLITAPGGGSARILTITDGAAAPLGDIIVRRSE